MEKIDEAAPKKIIQTGISVIGVGIYEWILYGVLKSYQKGKHNHYILERNHFEYFKTIDLRINNFDNVISSNYKSVIGTAKLVLLVLS